MAGSRTGDDAASVRNRLRGGLFRGAVDGVWPARVDRVSSGGVACSGPVLTCAHLCPLVPRASRQFASGSGSARRRGPGGPGDAAASVPRGRWPRSGRACGCPPGLTPLFGHIGMAMTEGAPPSRQAGGGTVQRGAANRTRGARAAAGRQRPGGRPALADGSGPSRPSARSTGPRSSGGHRRVDPACAARAARPGPRRGRPGPRGNQPRSAQVPELACPRTESPDPARPTPHRSRSGTMSPRSTRHGRRDAVAGRLER